MNRCLIFLCSLALAMLTVSSACFASSAEWINFTLEPAGNGQIEARFHKDDERGRNSNNWSSGFPASQLVGLDIAGFHAAGNKPLRFAVVREAGRLDCSGQGGNSMARGNCSFTPDPAFMQLLASRGIGHPTREQAFGLMAINARRELIEQVAAAGYPTPSIDDLMGLTALGVDGRYIRELAGQGYRPSSTQSLIQFKALGITPAWIGGFTRIGYGTVPPNELVQLKALGVTPDFVQGFERAGYGRLPVNTLVQFKALGITPEFARSAMQQTGRKPTVDELVQMHLFGVRR